MVDFDTFSIYIYEDTETMHTEPKRFWPDSAHDLNKVNEDPVMMQNSYIITKGIRGTAAYWKSVLLQLLAMVKTLGPPTFFVTLSCNDNWPEIQSYINLHKESQECNNVTNDPLMAAMAFQQRWNA